MKAIDSLLKLTVIAGVLIASFSVGYYYVVYLPNRDSRLEAQRSIEQVGIRLRYQNCLSNAYELYSADWANSCKRIANDSIKRHGDCVSQGTFPRATCDRVIPISDGKPDCSLPKATADNHQATLEKARDRCLQESRLGLQ
jgi:hypothetical protein